MPHRHWRGWRLRGNDDDDEEEEEAEEEGAEEAEAAALAVEASAAAGEAMGEEGGAGSRVAMSEGVRLHMSMKSSTGAQSRHISPFLDLLSPSHNLDLSRPSSQRLPRRVRAWRAL